MCEYCGCHQNDNIAQLMDEHERLLDMGDTTRRLLDEGRVDEAMEVMKDFRPLMSVHGKLEEAGIFKVMKEAGEFVDVIEDLETDHRTVDEDLAKMADPDVLRAELDRLMADLTEHIEKENRGIFPFAYSAFSPEQWSEVDAAHEADHDKRHELGIRHHH